MLAGREDQRRGATRGSDPPINPFSQVAIMIADPKEPRGKLPLALRHLPVLRKPFRIEQLLRQPVLPL
jgi:hypothetical protein